MAEGKGNQRYVNMKIGKRGGVGFGTSSKRKERFVGWP